VECTPREHLLPESEAAVAECVQRAAALGVPLRTVGSGHSFSPLVATDGFLVSLERFAGIEAHDVAGRSATVRAGTVLHALGEELLARGLAMENLGDVDVQSLGGALGTGTHGTGHRLRNLSSQATALRLVLASGEVLELTQESDPERLAAARVSLGVLGVVTAIQLRLVPAYRLHERIRHMPAEACLELLEPEIRAHRHFEFFWYGPKDLAEVKTLDPTEDAPDPLPGRKGERIDWSARILPSVRELRFTEMEYSLPAASGPAAFRAVRDRMRARHPEVQWPVEYRTVAADDAWLSPAHERQTVTISIHQDARLPFRELFADLEGLLCEYGGRPHWGKVHTRRAAELRALYPRFDDFLALRAELDPEGRFLNQPLREVFGL